MDKYWIEEMETAIDSINEIESKIWTNEEKVTFVCTSAYRNVAENHHITGAISLSLQFINKIAVTITDDLYALECTLQDLNSAHLHCNELSVESYMHHGKEVLNAYIKLYTKVDKVQSHILGFATNEWDLH